tara:strand:+ start:305 stop:544 length:240 start_codon:yes stop_codon:yes gene_type:complete
MKITVNRLRRIILEEMNNLKRQRLQESTRGEIPIKVTSKYLNRIIREEYSAFQDRKRLAESRRRQRRIAESRRRRYDRY